MRLLFTTLLGIATLAAQEPASANVHKEKAMQNAIANLGKIRARLTERQVRVNAPRTCSVPLRVVPIEKPDQFAIRRVPMKDVAPMPQVSVPAPPCETTAR